MICPTCGREFEEYVTGGRFLTWSGVEDDIRQYLSCPVCGEPNQEPEIDGLADDDQIPF